MTIPELAAALGTSADVVHYHLRKGTPGLRRDTESRPDDLPKFTYVLVDDAFVQRRAKSLMTGADWMEELIAAQRQLIARLEAELSRCSERERSLLALLERTSEDPSEVPRETR